jgi:hypothetical protein
LARASGLAGFAGEAGALRRTVVAGARVFRARGSSIWLATRRLSPRNQIFVRFFDIG